MDNSIKMYIVDIEENTISRLKSLFYKNPDLGIEVIGFASNYNQCINDFSRAREANLFLVSAYLPDTMGIELISQIKKLNPDALILVTLTENTEKLADQALDKGANDFILKPFKARNLLDKIDILINGEDTPDYEIEDHLNEEAKLDEPLSRDERIDYQQMQVEERLKSHLDPNKKTHHARGMQDVFSNANPYYSEEKNEEEHVDKPNQVIVFSSTGSYGKSTLLVNSAISIKRLSSFDPKICIVDFNLIYPSILYKFHHDDLIPCKKNIFDLFDDINDLKPSLLESAMYTHEPSGIKILHTPSEMIRDFSNITPDSINQLISHLRSMFDLVIIDTSSNIKDDFASFPITIADKTFIVLEPDLTSILHTHKLLNLLKLFENNLDEKILPKINLVLNKESPRNKVDLELFKKSLMNFDIQVTIPEDPNMTILSNDGKFVVDSNTSSSKHIRTLANFVYPLDPDYQSRTLGETSSTQKMLDSFKNLFGSKKKK